MAAALKESFESRGAGCDVMDGLGFISKKASKFVSKWHTRFYRRYPELYKAGYMSAEKDQGMDRRDGPVYRYIARARGGWDGRSTPAATAPWYASM